MNWYENIINNHKINKDEYNNEQNNEIHFENVQNEINDTFICSNLKLQQSDKLPFQQSKSISIENLDENESESEEEEEEDDESFVAEDDEKIKEENKKKKCSLTEHGEINAISFCNECICVINVKKYTQGY